MGAPPRGNQSHVTVVSHKAELCQQVRLTPQEAKMPWPGKAVRLVARFGSDAMQAARTK